MIGVVYCVNDPAGRGIAEYLVRELNLHESSICKNATSCFEGEKAVLAGFTEEVVYFDYLDERLPSTTDFYLVLSRHSSESRIKSYTVHTTGNFSDTALLGGRPRELGIAYPSVKWFLLRVLNKLAVDFKRIEEYEVSYEATHHGPTNLSKPIVFIEIGSGVDEWRDPVNHALLGEAVKMLLDVYPTPLNCKPVIGIGGGHYPRRHTELALKHDVCYGHIASKHVLGYLDAEILRKMVQRTREQVLGIVVEKKGTKSTHRTLLEGFSRVEGLTLEYI